MARDITQRKRAEAAREQLHTQEQQSLTALEEAIHLKDEFLATLSHELRNPLNTIMGYNEILRRSPEAKQSSLVRQVSDTMHRNAAAQAQLIDDLLDLSRLQTGKFTVDRRPVSLAPLVGDAIESVRAQAEEKELKLTVDFIATSLVVNADPVRVQQIVWNLVNNAVKFTPRNGQVSVCLSMEREEAARDEFAGQPILMPKLSRNFVGFSPPIIANT